MSELSIVIPWSNRDELGQTLAANTARAADLAVEFVVVDCGGDPGRCAAALAHAGVPVTLVEIPTETFDKGLALNLGVHFAAAETLLLLDADVILSEGCLAQLLAAVGPRSFATVERVLESDPPPDAVGGQALTGLAHVVELIDGSGRRIRVETNHRHFDIAGGRSGPGLIALRRDHYLAVEGMNSDLEGWGWEDVDLIARLLLREVGERRCVGAVTHLSHSDELRTRSGAARFASEQHNFAVCLANYRLGHWLGTHTDDVETAAAVCTVRAWRPSTSREIHP